MKVRLKMKKRVLIEEVLFYLSTSYLKKGHKNSVLYAKEKNFKTKTEQDVVAALFSIPTTKYI